MCAHASFRPFWSSRSTRRLAGMVQSTKICYSIVIKLQILGAAIVLALQGKRWPNRCNARIAQSALPSRRSCRSTRSCTTEATTSVMLVDVLFLDTPTWWGTLQSTRGKRQIISKYFCLFIAQIFYFNIFAGVICVGLPTTLCPPWLDILSNTTLAKIGLPVKPPAVNDDLDIFT